MAAEDGKMRLIEVADTLAMETYLTKGYSSRTWKKISNPRMEQLGYTQTDLAKVVGLKSRASEILSKKRKLSLDMIRQLHDKLNIPTDVLIQAY